VEEGNLARHVSVIRKILRGFDGDREYIVTLAGRGYRFAFPVTRVEAVGRSHIDGQTTQCAEDAAPDEAAGGSRPLVSEAVLRQHRTGDAGALRSPAVFTSVFVLLAVVLAAVTYGFVYAREERQPPRHLWQATMGTGMDLDPSWSPDGQSLAFVSDRSGNLDIWVQRVADVTPRRLTFDPAPDRAPSWSPDGKWVAFRSERDGGGLFLVPSAGGPIRRLTAFGYEPKWSPDGQLLLFNERPKVGPPQQPFVISVAGGPARPVRPDVVKRFGRFWVAWCPGEAALSIYGNEVTDGWSFWTVPLDAGAPRRAAVSADVGRRLRAAAVSLGAFSWSPSGDALYFEGTADQTQNIWRIKVDSGSGRWVGGPDRLTMGTGHDAQLAVSPDGRRIAFSSRSERTRVWGLPLRSTQDPAAGMGEPVGPAGPYSNVVDASANGLKVAYRAVRRGTEELWVRRADTNLEQLGVVEAGASILQPRWSHDGMRLAYLQSSPGARNDAVVVLSADLSSAQKQRLALPGANLTNVFDWTSNATALLVGCTPSTGFTQICELPLDGRPAALRVLAASPSARLTAARSSPDGRWISFIAHSDSKGEHHAQIFVMPAEGGRWTPVTDGTTFDDKPRWTAESDALYYLSYRWGFWNLWRKDLDSATGRPLGASTQITSFNSPARMIAADPGLQFQFSVTRSRIIFPITDSAGSIWVLDGVER
jgi:Tol biopolymer transport system component